MREPSIKGSAFLSAREDLRRALAEGRIARSALEKRLEAKDLELLERKILPGAWYPVETYRRYVETLCELEGGDRRAYLRGRGARAMERLMGLGLYRQFESLSQGWTPRAGEFMLSLSQSLYSFTRWSFHPGPPGGGIFRVEVSEAEAFPEVARFTAEGAIERLATLVAGAPVEVTSQRPSPDRIIYEARRVEGDPQADPSREDALD